MPHQLFVLGKWNNIQGLWPLKWQHVWEERLTVPCLIEKKWENGGDPIWQSDVVWSVVAMFDEFRLFARVCVSGKAGVSMCSEYMFPLWMKYREENDSLWDRWKILESARHSANEPFQGGFLGSSSTLSILNWGVNRLHVGHLLVSGAIFEFINGLPDEHVLLPKWLMDDLGISERLGREGTLQQNVARHLEGTWMDRDGCFDP